MSWATPCLAQNWAIDYAAQDNVNAKHKDRVDYAIMAEGKPVLLIDCVAYGSDLWSKARQVKLAHQFETGKAKFAAVTNGVEWRFHTDMDQARRMDSEPYFVFDFRDYDDMAVEMLAAFAGPGFDVALCVAKSTEYSTARKLTAVLDADFRDPSPEFVRYLAKAVHNGSATDKMQSQVAELVPRALAIVFDRVARKGLQAALEAMCHERGDAAGTPRQLNAALKEGSTRRRTRKVSSRPVAWGFGEDRHEVKHWYEIPDALVARHLASGRESSDFLHLQGSLAGRFSNDAADFSNAVQVAPDLYRARAMSRDLAMKMATAQVVDVLRDVVAEFFVEVSDGTVYRIDETGAMQPASPPPSDVSSGPESGSDFSEGNMPVGIGR